MKLKIALGILSLSTIVAISGCGSSGSSNPTGEEVESNTTDMAIVTMIDQASGYLNMVDGSKTQTVKNTNSEDINPFKGVYTYNGFIYLTGSMGDNKISKYSVNEDNSLNLEKEITVSDSGASMPTTLIFVNDTKAYLTLVGSGELLVINPIDLTITKRISLAEYAMDENGTLGGDDTNPEPSGGVLRDGKLYLGLGQVNTLANVAGAWMCRGKASVLIIDATSDVIEKHITDDRTCSSSNMAPQSKMTLDENGDIYVNNIASLGYDPSKKPGYLRIKNSEDDFDSSYFFPVGDLDLSADFPEMNASLAKTTYTRMQEYKDGELYTLLNINGLLSTPADQVNDKSYQPYKLDLVNKTATKLDMLPTSGWASTVTKYKNQIIFPASTVNGNGLYKVGEKTPYIITDGQPVNVIEFEK